MSSRQANLLILSDLHLGEDLKPSTKIGFLRHVAILERELEAFLRHYTHRRLDGRPWRLIINGDMVDFLAVCVMPQPQTGDFASEETDPEDRVYGLGTRPHDARAKMTAVLERHPGVFRALGLFISAGNDVEIIVGNHDVEFHWPVVQETFKKGVSALWAESREAKAEGAPTRDDLESAMTFHPWFYFEENVAWVEHGHQYDTYCSFDYIMNPVAPDTEEILLNVGAAGNRYVSNHIQGADPHQQEDWTYMGYIKWGLSYGARGIWKIAKSYAAMAARMLTLWRVLVKRPVQVEERRKTHRIRVREWAKKMSLSEETLLAVEQLRKRPVVLNFFKLAMALMLDRLMVAGATALIVLVFVLALPWTWALAAVGGAIGTSWAVGRLVERNREPIDPAQVLKQVPQRIRAHVNAPFVVFGHTHDPVALRLDDGGWYFNTGTWVPTEKPGLLRSFTHLLIRHSADGPRAALCQWREGRSHAFMPEAKAT